MVREVNLSAHTLHELFFVLVALPAIIGLLQRSVAAVLIGILFVASAGLVALYQPVLGGVIWLAGCVIAYFVGHTRRRRDDAERRHREVLQAIQRNEPRSSTVPGSLPTPNWRS
jgi:hypothetical protein